MSDSNGTQAQEAGFELDGSFYRWSITDQGKDLMLIDRFTQMPVTEFFEQVGDGLDTTRTPVLLAALATSIRAGHPAWTVERITQLVMDTNLSDIEFIAGEAEDDISPPAEAAEPAATPGRSSSTPDGFSSSPTPTASSPSTTSSGDPA